LKGLILAQNERWRRGLGMQVGGISRKGGNRRKGQLGVGTHPGVRDSRPRGRVIPDDLGRAKVYRPGRGPRGIS